MEAYIVGDNETGSAKMRETLPLYEKSLNDCEQKDEIFKKF